MKFPLEMIYYLALLFSVAESLKIGSRHTQNNNRFIYIDLGAHDGLSIDTFLPSESSTSTSSFRRASNTAMDGSSAVVLDGRAFFVNDNGSHHHHPMFDKRNYEIIAVEANPAFTAQLEMQQRRYDATMTAKSYSLFNGTGISTKNGVGHLILDCAGCDTGSAGSSLTGLSAVGKKVPIRLLDISALFRGLRIRAEDFVFVKMDIEGLEYDIVRKMVVSGMLDHLVDKIAVEWHHTAFYVFGKPHDVNSSDYKKRLAIHEKYLRQYESIQWMCEENDLTKKFIAWG